MSESPLQDSPLKDLLKHLEGSRAQELFSRVDDLRKAIVRVGILMMVLVCIGFVYAKDVFDVLKIPLADALPGKKAVLHFTGPLEVMLSYMKVSFLISATLSAPFAFFQGWRFVGPALPAPQRRMVIPFVTASIVLFTVGVVFCYFVMLPTGLHWLIAFGGDQAAPVITVEAYVDLVAIMLLGFGAAFQLPLFVILLERLGIISEATLRKNRAGILVGILVVAALVCPSPDPFSFLAMAIPMYLLFEVALLVIRRMKAKENLPVPK